MKSFTLPIAKNVNGANALDLFYEGLNATWAQYGFTKDNSTIHLVQPFGRTVDDAIVQISKNETPHEIEAFIFNRYSIRDIVKNPAFTTAELTQISAMDSSEKLLKFMAAKYNRNFTADDFWVSINDIPDAGGQVKPNWIMCARYNSLFWYDTMSVWLHR